MKVVFTYIIIFYSLTLLSNTYKVGSKNKITSIQQALDISSDGDTIYVDSGIYKEKNIIIKDTREGTIFQMK